MLPSLFFYYSLDCPCHQLLNLSPVSHMASTILVQFLVLISRSSALPNPVLNSVPVPVPVRVRVPVSATALVSVPAPVLLPILPCIYPWVSTLVPLPVPTLSLLPSPFPPCCVRSIASTPAPGPAPSPSLSPFTSPFLPRPRSRLCSRPRLRFRPQPRWLLPVPRTRLAPRYNALVQTPSLANGVVECPQAPPPVCRDNDACGMKVPTVKQKRITTEGVLLPSPPPDAGTRWSVSPTCVLYPPDGEFLNKGMDV